MICSRIESLRQKMLHEAVEMTVRFLESRQDFNRAGRSRQHPAGQREGGRAVRREWVITNVRTRPLWIKPKM